ncbi:hypothetical protein KAR91_68500 [Candidatus Pacearchaeota archaeon]|nr:hypothetical protein [Candidatus Pacearchaeota archaeon]
MATQCTQCKIDMTTINVNMVECPNCKMQTGLTGNWVSGIKNPICNKCKEKMLISSIERQVVFRCRPCGVKLPLPKQITDLSPQIN